MMLAYLLPLNGRVLAFRYLGATAVQMLIWWLHQASNWALFWSVFPSPWMLVSETATFIRLIGSLFSGYGGITFIVLWIAMLVQLIAFVGLIRFAVWKYAPQMLAEMPVVGIPENLVGELAGSRLRRPWWLVPAFMGFATIVTTYLIVGAVRYVFQPSGGFMLRGTLIQSIETSGAWPLYVALGLTALGIAWGWRFVQESKVALSQGFGVKYLPDDHWLTQRVHRIADRLDLPRPAVGATREFNAFACGPSPDSAAVVIGAAIANTFPPEELDAIIGHELGHIASGDMRQMQLAEGFQSMFGNVFGTAITLLGSLAASQVRDRSASLAIGQASGAFNHLGRYTIAIISELMVKGLSRNREYYADAVGAALTTPDAMKGALVRIHQPTAKPANVETAYGYLMFRGSGFGNLLSTHPTLNQRTAALDRGTYMLMLPRTKRGTS